MPLIKVLIRFVWITKNREPFLATKEPGEKIWHHIKENWYRKAFILIL